MVERTKKDILEAFNRLIKNIDMDKITVEMIIKEADISKATFYRYFRDKYDVMNYNYTRLLDSLTVQNSITSYKSLYRELYIYGKRHWQYMQKAFATYGKNSFGEYIENYSRSLVEKITEQNRQGQGLTATEQLQCDVLLNGIAFMYEKWIFSKYSLSPDEAAEALYNLMPESLRDMWWIEMPTQ